MSLQFSDTSTGLGIVQQTEFELSLDPGDISSNARRLKYVTASVNLAWDRYLALAFEASGNWQYDDSNHADMPFIKTDLVQGQRIYPFTTDEQGNLILDIFKVAILPASDATLFQEITPIDQQTPGYAPDMVSENTAQGIPDTYDKTANTIILGTIPSYNATSGLKVYINREASRFTTSDTTKKPGCPGLHHRYFALKAAYDDARRQSLAITGSLLNEILRMERDISEYFSRRSKDERPRMTPKLTPYI